jgi:hypothetical protein
MHHLFRCMLHGFTTYSTRMQSTIEMHSKAHTAEVVPLVRCAGLDMCTT